MAPRRSDSIYDRIRQILESARASVARSVNTTQVVAYWLIGREIVEEQQQGQRRADYGSRLLIELSSRLQGDFGKGFSVNNLEHFRDFYLTYPGLIDPAKSHALRVELADASETRIFEISHAVRGKSRQRSRVESGDPTGAKNDTERRGKNIDDWKRLELLERSACPERSKAKSKGSG